MNMKTNKYPAATVKTRAQMSLMLNEPGHKEVYRQTRARFPHNWCFPKALTEEGKWRPIKNGKYVNGRFEHVEDDKYVVKKHKDGMAFAIWRMWDLKCKAKTKAGKKKWEPQIYVVFYSKAFTLYYLVCQRLRHSLSGGGY